MNVLKIIGIVLLVAGVAFLVFGGYNLISFMTSTGGKIAKAFGVSSRADTVRDSVIYMLVGAGSAGLGFFLYKRK